MGKTRDLFKKIREYFMQRKYFHISFISNKGKNSKDLTDKQDIKKGWQEYTELYKQDRNDPDNHNGVITHLEPDILEYKSNGP